MSRVFLLFVLAIIGLAECYKILTLFPVPGKSHNILGEGVVRILTEAGHEVTHITPFPKDPPPKNYREIDTSEIIRYYPDDILNMTALLDNKSASISLEDMLKMFVQLADATYEVDNLKKLINDENEQFDVVIIEWLLMEIGVGLPEVFNCPFIWVSTVEPHPMVLSLIDEAVNPAYNPDMLSNNVVPFTFYQRVQELISLIGGYYFKAFQLGPIEASLYEKHFGPAVAKRGRSLTSFWEKKYQASLMLGNSHVSLGQATRLPQNYIPIGGYHIDPKLKPLPEDLKKLIEGSKNGLIYFSMGSNLKSKYFPDVIKKDLLKMFGSLPYTVLWKFEEELSGRPENVHILKWAPQPSILAHPNTKLFITHGGLLSTTETVHYGVPIIGIPAMADQFVNVKRAERRGFAKEVNLSYELAAKLKEAIDEVLGNPKYKQKVKELSLIYHDRVATPAQELRHWVEHVVRTGGAPHLASPALMVPWYQKLYLDLLVLVIALLYVIQFVIRKLISRLFRKKSVSKNKKNK